MAIKRVTYDTLKFLVAEIKERYAEKGDIGALGGLDKVAVEKSYRGFEKPYKRESRRSYNACRLWN